VNILHAVKNLKIIGDKVMKKRLEIFTLVFTLIVVISNPVLAAPTTEQVQIQKEQLQADKAQLKKAQDKRFEIEQKIENLDNQIEDVMDKIKENKKQIDKAKEDIKTAEKELKQAEEDTKAEQDLFNKRMRAIYINGIGGYFDVILGAKGLSDFLSRIETVKSIIQLDQKITTNLKLKQQELNSKKQALNEQNIKLLALKNSCTLSNLACSCFASASAASFLSSCLI
jgi:peptidoglycan hydrolase CwlO-like protein